MGKHISIKQYHWSHLQHPPDLHAFLHITLNAYKITPSIIAAVQQLLGLTLSKKSIYSIKCKISIETSSLGNRLSKWLRMLQSETETKKRLHFKACFLVICIFLHPSSNISLWLQFFLPLTPSFTPQLPCTVLFHNIKISSELLEIIHLVQGSTITLRLPFTSLIFIQSIFLSISITARIFQQRQCFKASEHRDVN